MGAIAASAGLAGLRLGIYTRASDDHDATETSVTAQAGFGDRWAEAQGCVIADHYCDNDKSASWYAKKPRQDFERLLGDIAAGKLDLVWFWTISRSQRDLGVYVKLRDLCRRHNVRMVIKKRVYDLSDAADLRALGNGAVDAEIQSIELSENVRLGMELAASLGKPHGPTTYGYRRIYDDKGKYVTQEPHEDRARIVEEIITRVSKGDYIARIARELEERGVPSPSGGPNWSRAVVTSIAKNPAYIGKRVYRGEVLELPGPCWPPLVSEDVFYACQAVLNSPSRKTTKPGRARHLLSYIVLCECGRQLQANSKGSGRSPMYACPKDYNQISEARLDEFVRAVIDGYLAREDVKAFIAQAQADDSGAVAARTEVNKLRVELEENRQAREAGALDLTEYLRFKASLEKRIKAAEDRAEEASVPPILRAGAVDWEDIPVARQIVTELARITLLRGDKASPMRERIGWEWLIGPDSGGSDA